MIKLWRKLIYPIMRAAEVENILEIGAEYGTSTAVLLKYVKEHKGHLSCIDPAPEFDPSDLQQLGQERFSFYRGLSLDVLSSIPRFDAAMIDGDHNWYSVYQELVQIEKSHGYSALSQPLLFIHDIGWPYGRRDLYYNPATIPNEHRHEYQVGGVLPNHSELCGPQGLNTALNHATHEGGPKNGVLTALEDYLAQSQLKFRYLNFPLYFGLGILVTQERIQDNPVLAALLDEYESVDGMKRIAELAEHLRSVDGVMMQTIGRRLAVAQRSVTELGAGTSEPMGGEAY